MQHQEVYEVFENIQITIDASDPDRLAEFWAEALDYEVQSLGDDSSGNYQGIVDPSGKRPGMVFQRVPEPKTVKNRVHLDLPHNADKTLPFDERRDQLSPIVERLVEAGASRQGEGSGGNEFWIVMADPEGNEFCVG